MNFPEQMLARLKAEQASFALQAMQRPQTRDAFEYGHRSGIVQGYEAAINVLLTLLKEEREGERDL
jgi:hypothetical protein